MLYSVAGSQGTGKSTVLSDLSQKYKTVTRKTSRSILSDWGVSLSEVNNDHKLTIKFQEEILKRKIEDEKDALQSEEVWFTERTYADLFVYALVTLGKDNEYSNWLDEYYERCRAAQLNYTHIFFLTAGHFTPVNDGVRGINKYYSKMVDMTMSYFTHNMCDNITTVYTPVQQERIELIERAVLSYTK